MLLHVCCKETIQNNFQGKENTDVLQWALTFMQWTGAELKMVNSRCKNLMLEDTTTGRVKYTAARDSPLRD